MLVLIEPVHQSWTRTLIYSELYCGRSSMCGYLVGLEVSLWLAERDRVGVQKKYFRTIK